MSANCLEVELAIIETVWQGVFLVQHDNQFQYAFPFVKRCISNNVSNKLVVIEKPRCDKIYMEIVQ